jgi:transcriptional regulator with XRE-family HTH domain
MTGAVERRAAEQASRMSGEVRLARLTLALSRQEVARRAGVARSTVERIEAGDAGISVLTLTRVTMAVGLDAVLRAYPSGRVGLRDSGQMQLAEQERKLAAPYWTPRLEVAAGNHGESADVVFLGAEEIQHHEIERRAADFQGQYRAARRKQEFLASRSERPVRLVLVIEDTRKNREALRPHARLIAAELPADSRAILKSLRLGRPVGADGMLWLRRREA